MSSVSVTHEQLAVFVELVAGFRPGDGEVRTLLSVARMLAASSAKGDGGQGVLDTPITPDAAQALRRSFRTSVEQARAAEHEAG